MKEGQPVKFLVEFKGHPKPTVSWFRESIRLENTPDFQITTKDGTSQLFISEVFADDSGKFSCTLENSSGKAETVADLLVEVEG